jgi:hypothetical protein
MKDPISWSHDGGDAGELELAVLRSDRDMAPTAGDSAVVWGRLAGELGLATTLASVATAKALAHGASATSGTQALGAATLSTAKTLVPAAGGALAFIKGVAVGVTACCAIWGGSRLLDASSESRKRADTGSAPATVVAGSERVAELPNPPSPVAPGLRDEQAFSSGGSTTTRRQAPGDSGQLAPNTPEAPSRPAPSVAQFGELNEAPDPSTEQRASDLKQEALLLRQARQRLRAGDLTSAHHLLEESKARFAVPQLHQEREALAIELLFRSDQRAAAERARLFLKAFPESPHASHVRTFAAP